MANGVVVFSMGLHFANNTFLALFVANPGDIVGSYAPFVYRAPTLERTVLFALSQAVFFVVAIELMFAGALRPLLP